MDKSLHPFHFVKEEKKFLARPILPLDKALLQKGFSELSERSRYFRFFALQYKLTDNQLKYFTEVDGMNHVAWIILDETLRQHLNIIPTLKRSKDIRKIFTQHLS